MHDWGVKNKVFIYTTNIGHVKRTVFTAMGHNQLPSDMQLKKIFRYFTSAHWENISQFNYFMTDNSSTQNEWMRNITLWCGSPEVDHEDESTPPLNLVIKMLQQHSDQLCWLFIAGLNGVKYSIWDILCQTEPWVFYSWHQRLLRAETHNGVLLILKEII